MLNKVPEVTLYFWIIKILCTTVGETAADNLNANLKLGLTTTTYVMSGLLLVALFFQFKAQIHSLDLLGRGSFHQCRRHFVNR
jgi:uncharacterized membrane-anchored protein